MCFTFGDSQIMVRWQSLWNLPTVFSTKNLGNPSDTSRTPLPFTEHRTLLSSCTNNGKLFGMRDGSLLVRSRFALDCQELRWLGAAGPSSHLRRSLCPRRWRQPKDCSESARSRCECIAFCGRLCSSQKWGGRVWWKCQESEDGANQGLVLSSLVVTQGA